jgi:hypothetical protein
MRSLPKNLEINTTRYLRLCLILLVFALVVLSVGVLALGVAVFARPAFETILCANS